MANPEHVKILKQGVEVWNRWRKENPEIKPNLDGALLEGASLDGVRFVDVSLVGAHLNNSSLVNALLFSANLSHAELNGATLSGSRLGGANLAEAELEYARINNAEFSGANLHGADLLYAILDGTSFVGANLDYANLDETGLAHAYLANASLVGANLTDARFAWTGIVDVDLSKCKGLKTTLHRGPSGIATSTLERTAEGLATKSSGQGEVEAFFRDAGIEDHWIDYFRSQIGQPIAFYSGFISYSHDDKNFARHLHDQLQARGIRCWLDEHDLKPGDRILNVVNDAIRLHDKILLCCSESPLNSWWVKDEIRKALERERRDGRDIIIPLMVDRYLLDGWEDGMAADLRSRLPAEEVSGTRLRGKP